MNLLISFTNCLQSYILSIHASINRLSTSVISPNWINCNKNLTPSAGALRYLVFVFTSILALVSLSSNFDQSYALVIEEKDENTNGKIYPIDTKNNNDSLSTIVNSKDYFTNIDKGNELFDEEKYEEAITYYDKALATQPNSIENFIESE